MMRPLTPALALTAALALALSACTSEDPTTDRDGGSAPTTAGPEGAVPTSGWWCGLIEQETVETATGGRSAEAREVIRVNDGERYRCDVLLPTGEGDTTELALTLEVVAGDEDRATRAREEVLAMDGVEAGPDYLGESYQAPGMVVGIMPCGAPVGSEQQGSQVTWTFLAHALLPEGEQVTDLLARPLNRQAREVDMQVGCAPSRAQEPMLDGSATTAP